MRALILAVVVALVAMPAGAVEVTTGNNVIVSRGSTTSGPRILGEPAFAFELDALEQAEASRPGWPVTTTRASTRMCLGPGGQWQTVPENTPCIGRYGLVSFGPGTNYWANSTSPELWSRSGQPVVSGNTVTDTDVVNSEGVYIGTAGSTGMRTVSCVMRSGTTSKARLYINTNGTGAGGCNITLTSTPQRYSCTREIGGTPTFVNGIVYVGHIGADTGSIVIDQCQFEHSSTPGPRHDCGGSACSWAADVHTVSTAGWPVAAGRIDLQYAPLNPADTSFRAFVDTRQTGGQPGGYLFYWGGGALRLLNGAGVVLASSSPVALAAANSFSVEWGGGRVRFYSGGTLLNEVVGVTMPVAPLLATAAIGSERATGNNPANGHLRLIRVSEAP